MLKTQQGTKWDILSTLREDDEATLKELKNDLEVSPSTLNEHLSDLQAQNLIDKRSERDGPGRPHYVYYLTEEAEHLFPHAYAELAEMLLDVIRSLASEPEAQDKISAIMEEHLQQFDDLETALSTFGFYPEITWNGDKKQSIKYHQCPFYDVAKDDPSLCCIDQSVLEELTGGPVEMESSIVQGDNVCKFALSEN